MKAKRILCAALAVVVLCALLPLSAAAASLDPSDFADTSWFGEFVGSFNGNPFNYYIDFTIDSCASDGSITGSSKVRTVEGQSITAWYSYSFTGKIDFSEKTLVYDLEKVTGHSSGIYVLQQGIECSILTGANGDMSISGTYSDSRLKDLPFSASKTSKWAKEEMTEANIIGLIPDTLENADMSKSVTRAEFAAVAVQLYEKLTGQEATPVATPFTDIAGNVNKTSIEKAYGLNIAIGISDTLFAPNDKITREQLATMLCRTVKKYAFEGWSMATDKDFYLDTSGVALFADDGDISDFAKPSVYYMAKMGIIKGVDDTHFAPKNVTPEQEASGYATATREQAIIMSLRIYRISDMLK